MDYSLPSYLKPINEVISGQVTTNPTINKMETVKPSSSLITKKNIRFMLVSTHVQQYTGYSKVSHGILQELSKVPNLDLIHFGFQKHPNSPPDFRPYPSNVDVIDAASLENPLQQGFGFQALVEQIKKKNPHYKNEKRKSYSIYFLLQTEQNGFFALAKIE